MSQSQQPLLFPDADFDEQPRRDTSSTFADNLSLPVHRWFRYSAGFSAGWAEAVIADAARHSRARVLDPFAGSGTTLLAAEDVGVEALGVEAHPFICRVARAKLLRRTDHDAYKRLARRVRTLAEKCAPDTTHYPALIQKCYTPEALAKLDALRRALLQVADMSPAWELTWLTLASVLRVSSFVGTAQWQYVLPKKEKKRTADPFDAFDAAAHQIACDMRFSSQRVNGPPASLFCEDARTCASVPDGFATLVVTSPPYPNNYDYADATRLEMCFFGEINGWGDLQTTVRDRLIRSCSQHVPQKAVALSAVLTAKELAPLQPQLGEVCEQLSAVRETKGGKKTYHLMVACYFHDLARVWTTLRRVCASPSRVCFVIGDSAPYGVYVPVMDWLGRLALAAGFSGWTFEKMRDRNVKWKNRKHRVPLCEGRLWVDG
jgi:hypothetical protein